MNYRFLVLFPIIFFSLFNGPAVGQSGDPFDIDVYEQFLSQHQDLTAEELQIIYPAGSFLKEAASNSFEQSLFSDSIEAYYRLTDFEKSLLRRHDFVVTERLIYPSFGEALVDIYKHDLPVFISADAILHALHMSYDAILRQVEESALIPQLRDALASLHSELSDYLQQGSAIPELETHVRDVDVYLTVARKLLGEPADPLLAVNRQVINELLNHIQGEQAVLYPLFSTTRRIYDFSQFTPRGHYTQSEELTRYFQAMIWLGRTELYLVAPRTDGPNQQTEEDIQRQTIDTVILWEIARAAGVLEALEDIDGILQFFVGESDNITLPNIQFMMQETAINTAGQLLDIQVWKTFQAALLEKGYAFQRINSQILMSDPLKPEQIVPASAFLLLGQRFVMDSYVTANVVYDRILHDGLKVRRMLPATLDVLFALGNNAAAQLLQGMLKQYHYAPNLSALRYLIDSYQQDYWQVSLYRTWLDAIRALNPPGDRRGFPKFMQTAAWWQEKMNTQLAAWAQLRHDNLLYAKQSYSGGITCEFPESYVEPLPEFYRALHAFAETAAAGFEKMNFFNAGAKSWIIQYFNRMQSVADTLTGIAVKQLNNTVLLSSEKHFLKNMLYETNICGTVYNGWYPDLFYTGEEGLFKNDLVVADIHTAPTDENGAPVGWVMHSGTGPVNLALVIAQPPGGQATAFVGPVLSYYEHVSTNFKRLSDEEWQTVYALEPSLRPAWANLYLADQNGESKGETISLITGGEPLTVSDPPAGQVPETIHLTQNYPNPFNAATIIGFSIPESLAGRTVEMLIYDIHGQLVRRLLQQPALPPGNYTVRWDGVADTRQEVASGTYVYLLKVGPHHRSGKMVLVK